MAETYEKTETVPMDLGSAYLKLVTERDPMLVTNWKVLFSNRSDDQAEVLYLTGMFSGAGILGLWNHGARKSLVFVKLYGRGRETEIRAIAGGTETWLGFDFRRHRNNVGTVFEILKR